MRSRGVASAAPMGRCRTAAFTLLALAVLTPAARADTIVFRVQTDILRMNGDGGDQRALTHGEQRYEWPSTADDGTLVASTSSAGCTGSRATGGARAADPDGRDRRHRGRPGRDAHARPPLARRRRIAYAQLIDGDPTTLWTPAHRHRPELPRPGARPAGLQRAVVDRQRPARPQPRRHLRRAGAGRAVRRRGGDNSEEPWFGRRRDLGTGFEAVASRDGTRIAVLEDDAADNDGLPTRVVLRLLTAAGPGAPPAFRCELALEAADTFALASPTFSPDGAGSPGRRATASTPRRSARSRTAARSASRS